ncbi:MAG: hypothetical protein K9N23_15620 [Akkermansiaceae bacterium]|nr:hypothetical protein [Akkermansiaceae bacterium]
MRALAAPEAWGGGRQARRAQPQVEVVIIATPDRRPEQMRLAATHRLEVG